ncbi:MAG: hypothetical protein WBE90_05605 [Xanthobacteraceae bacterium]|jgi:Tfp pilus assembly protein PilF
MNARNMPGFTAENAIFEAPAHYRTASVFDSQNGLAYLQPAMKNIACAYLWKALRNAPSYSVWAGLATAYQIACN